MKNLTNNKKGNNFSRYSGISLNLKLKFSFGHLSMFSYTASNSLKGQQVNNESLNQAGLLAVSTRLTYFVLPQHILPDASAS